MNIKNIAQNNGNKQNGKEVTKYGRCLVRAITGRTHWLATDARPYIKERSWPPCSYNIHNSRQVKCLLVYDILYHNDYFSRWKYWVLHARRTIVNIRLAPPCGTSASQAWVAKSKTFFDVHFEVWARCRKRERIYNALPEQNILVNSVLVTLASVHDLYPNRGNFLANISLRHY